MSKTLTDDQAQQVRDALQLAGVVLKHVETSEDAGSLVAAQRLVGRACLMLDSVLNNGGDLLLEIRMLRNIFAYLDGEEWDSDTTANIAQVFTDAGWKIHEPGHYDQDED